MRVRVDTDNDLDNASNPSRILPHIQPAVSTVRETFETVEVAEARRYGEMTRLVRTLETAEATSDLEKAGHLRAGHFISAQGTLYRVMSVRIDIASQVVSLSLAVAV